MDKTAIRNAATIIVIRDRLTAPRVLMGQRGKSAAFMPSKYVFPGGAVDPVDSTVPVTGLDDVNRDRLTRNSDLPPDALAAAAIRELWEETGQIVGTPGNWDAPQGWRGFAAAGYRPDAGGLTFMCRAVTPPGRPRRFDARFFAVDASCLATDPDDFSGAEDELSNLGWVPLADARSFDLPFITQVALSLVRDGLDRDGPPQDVPFYQKGSEEALRVSLGGRSPLDEPQD